MISKDQFLNRLAELSDFTKVDIQEVAAKMVEEKRINLEDWDDNYVLPKLFLVVYSSRLKDIWSPLTPSKEYHRMINELEAAL